MAQQKRLCAYQVPKSLQICGPNVRQQQTAKRWERTRKGSRTCPSVSCSDGRVLINMPKHAPSQTSEEVSLNRSARLACDSPLPVFSRREMYKISTQGNQIAMEGSHP